MKESGIMEIHMGEENYIFKMEHILKEHLDMEMQTVMMQY